MKIDTTQAIALKPVYYLYPRGFERYATRALEYHLASFDLLYGFMLMLPAWDSMNASIYRPLLGLIPDEFYWGLIFFSRGIFHMLALYINGRAWWTPYCRAAASAVSALFWVGFGTVLLFAEPFIPSLTFSLAVTAVASHIYCLRRSGRDAGMARKNYNT